MITKDQLIEMGKLGKPHGLKGEISFFFNSYAWDDVEADYLIVECDGLFVPFFLEEYRFKNDEEAFLKIKRIDNDTQASELGGCTVYLEKKQLPEDYVAQQAENGELDIDFYIGYNIQLSNGTNVGVIDGVDDSTVNELFCIVTPAGDEVLIPASDDYILEVDDNNKTIIMELPEGLLDLND